MTDVRARSVRSIPIHEVIHHLNEFAPLGAAEEWDNVGLLAGDASQLVSKVIVSVDLTSEVVKAARREKSNLIITHHPCIFPKNRGLSKILAGTPLFEALQSGIAVAAYHTNFDRCALEVIQKISQTLNIKPRGRLLDSAMGQLIKLVVFVPQTHHEGVRAALLEAGAGQIGNYDSCTFGVKGEGTFRGREGSKPFIGQPDKLEKAEEVRLETIFPKGLEQNVLAALLKAHPYEEVAYDFYPVEQPALSTGLVRGLGYGFWGDFDAEKPFPELANDVKSLFNIHGFWMTEPAPSSIRRVCFIAGKGASFVESAVQLECDLMITGEAGYHTALSGARRGMAVMEIGHSESEKFFGETMKNRLIQFGLKAEVIQTPTQKVWQGGTG
jgi:dinuclear metal center YbgI/SA1388 family protein